MQAGRRLGTRIAIATAAAIAAASAFGCESNSGPSENFVPAGLTSDRKWIEPSYRYYFFDDRGRLMSAAFAGGVPRLEFDHQFESRPNVTGSASGRWVAYQGKLRGQAVARGWRLDLENGEHQFLGQWPATVNGWSRISPDESQVLFIADSDESLQSSREGVFVFDATTDSLRFLRRPPESRIGEHSRLGLFASYSRDGDLLVRVGLLSLRQPQWNEYWMSRGGRSPLELVPAKEPRDRPFRWVLGEKTIPIVVEPAISSLYSHASMWAPDGKLVATLKDSGELVVGSQAEKSLSSGSCRQGLGIQGWIGGHRYVVYSIGKSIFLRETSTGRTARLPESEGFDAEFFWADSGPGLAPN